MGNAAILSASAVMIGLGAGPVRAAPAANVEFRDEPCQQSRRAGTFDVKPWNKRHREDVLDLLDQLASWSPGLVQRACAHRQPLLFRTRGNPYLRSGAFSDVTAGAIYFPDRYFERKHDSRLQTLAHELAHLSNATRRLNYDQTWIGATSPAIARMNDSIRELGLDGDVTNQQRGYDGKFLKHKAELDSLARSLGLPNWYAATSSEEAIAEVAARIACDDVAAINPRFVEMVRGALFGQTATEEQADRLFHQGLQAFGEGKMRHAVGFFEQALQCDPRLYEAERLAAMAQSALGQWSDVIHRCDRLLAECPGDAQLRAQLIKLRDTASSAHARRGQGLGNREQVTGNRDYGLGNRE